MLLSEIALLLAISQVFFLGTTTFLRHRNSYIGRLLVLFSICMLASLLFNLLSLPLHTPWSYILGRVSHATTAIIWLLSYAVFFDNRKVPAFAWVAITLYIGLRAIGATYYYVFPPVELDSPIYAFFYGIPQIIVTCLWLHTLVLTAGEYNQDLVENRRPIRIAIALVLSYFGLIMFTNGTFPLFWAVLTGSEWRAPEILTILLDVSYFPALVGLNVLLFRGDIETINAFQVQSDVHPAQQSSDDVLEAKDMALLDRVLHTMEVEKLYLNSGLTIRKLAAYLKIQEPKLRSIINRHLKYNNFSHFLNHYRIRDAEEKLLKTKDPVFNIGLDVGYASLSSFHKAFKDKHGSTPKEYRIRHEKD